MRNYTPSQLKEFAADHADTLTQLKIPFLTIFFPSEESEALIFRNGEIQAQVALVDTLLAEVHDDDIQQHDENLRLLAAASKEIESLRRRN